MYRALAIIFLLALLSSCDKEVGYDINDYDAYIVANSIVSTDSTWKVELSYSKSIFEKGEFDPVLGADVSIVVLAEDGEEQEEIQNFELEDRGNGVYSRGSYPLQGRSYRLTIKVDGQELNAETFVPRVPDAAILEQRIITNDESGGESSLELDLQLTNQEDRNNYYAWDIITIDSRDLPTDYEDGENGGGTSSGADGDTNIKSGNNPLNRNPGFTAVPFTSDDGKITIGGKDSSVGSTLISRLNQWDPDNEEDASTVSFKLRVWAISYDYYQYLVSIQQNAPASSEIHFVNPYSNVENGGGIFAGYHLQEIDLDGF